MTTSRPADRTTSTDGVSTAEVEPAWPTDEWSTSIPEDQGVDSETLASLFEQIVANDYLIDSVTIVRNGAIVAEAYAPGHGPRTKHIVHSCTKSVVSTLIGIAIEQGAISSVEAPFLELFPGTAVENVDDRKEALTLEDVLTMATGMDARDSYLYRWQGLNSMRAAEDWTTFALSIPMAAEPGTRFTTPIRVPIF